MQSRPSVLLIILFTFFFGLVLGKGTQWLQEIDEPPEYTTGQFEVSRASSNEVFTVISQYEVRSGDLIRSSGSHAWLHLRDNDRLLMNKDTTVHFTEVSESGYHFRVERGEIWLSLPSDNRSLRIDTPHKVLRGRRIECNIIVKQLDPVSVPHNPEVEGPVPDPAYELQATVMRGVLEYGDPLIEKFLPSNRLEVNPYSHHKRITVKFPWSASSWTKLIE